MSAQRLGLPPRPDASLAATPSLDRNPECSARSPFALTSSGHGGSSSGPPGRTYPHSTGKHGLQTMSRPLVPRRDVAGPSITYSATMALTQHRYRFRHREFHFVLK